MVCERSGAQLTELSAGPLPRLFVSKLASSDVQELSDPPGPLKKTWLGGQHRILVRTSLLATVPCEKPTLKTIQLLGKVFLHCPYTI
jgi:hypothetical protein